LLLILAVVLVSLLAVGRAGEHVCATPPISLSRLNGAIAQPAEPFAENVIQDEQLPVDDVNRRRAEAVLGQVVACANAGEPLRVWSLYSDAYLSRLFQIQGPFTEGQFAASARPLPAEKDAGMRLETIERVWQRGDGVIVAQVVTRYPSVPIPKRLLFWFVRDGKELEIEEVTGEISFSLP
jgi:hypothetical protein